MSWPHPMDSFTQDVPGGKPWISLIWGGISLQVIGGLMIGFSFNGATSADAEGSASHGAVATLVIGSILGWVGIVLLFVGIVAVGTYLGTRHLSDRLPDVTSPAAATPAGPDPTMVSVHEGDSAVVAQIRAMFRHGAPFALKATTASARRIADRAERKGQLSPQDKETIEALIADARRTD